MSDRDKERIAELLQELSDLRAGIAVHVHTCGEHTWRCTSPYCDSIAMKCLKHGGGPLGAPPTHEIVPRYERVPYPELMRDA